MKRVIYAAIIAIGLSVLAPHAMFGANADFEKALSSYNTRDYGTAIAKFAAAQKTGFQVSNCMYYQALCWQALGQPENAKLVYNEIVRLYPTSAAADQARIALNGAAGATTATAEATNAAPTKIDPSDWYMGYKVLAEIPFVDTREGMIVNVVIDGKNVPAMWDTGAAGMHFPKSQLVKYGVDLSKSRRAGIAYGIGGSVQTYELDATVSLGKESCRIPVSYEDDSVSQKNGQQDISEYGLIGEEFFGKYVYEVDPKAHTIRLLKKTSFDPMKTYRNAPIARNAYSTLGEPFRWKEAHIYVTAKVNGRECEMIFDTGCTGLAFTDHHLNSLGMTRPVESGEGRSFGVGGSRESYFFKLGSVELGPSIAKNVDCSVIVHGSHSAPLLGQSYLRNLRYIIDPEHQIIRIGKP